MLRDTTTIPKPYSWARMQLAWWTLIVLSAFIMIVCCSTGHQIPSLDSSTVILFGITSGTTASARLIDVSDQNNPNITTRSQDSPMQNFFLDILSNNNGVSLARLQTVIFNFVFGVWFVYYVLHNYCAPCAALVPTAPDCSLHPYSYVMPVISQTDLMLLGLSSTTYAAMKTTENARGSPIKILL